MAILEKYRLFRHHQRRRGGYLREYPALHEQRMEAARSRARHAGPHRRRWELLAALPRKLAGYPAHHDGYRRRPRYGGNWVSVP